MSITDSHNTPLSMGVITYPDTSLITLEWEHKICVGKLLSFTDKTALILTAWAGFSYQQANVVIEWLGSKCAFQ
jgi:hypothetical protein